MAGTGGRRIVRHSLISAALRSRSQSITHTPTHSLSPPDRASPFSRLSLATRSELVSSLAQFSSLPRLSSLSALSRRCCGDAPSLTYSTHCHLPPLLPLHSNPPALDKFSPFRSNSLFSILPAFLGLVTHKNQRTTRSLTYSLPHTKRLSSRSKLSLPIIISQKEASNFNKDTKENLRMII